jgi:multiple antibiotic resistance protein
MKSFILSFIPLLVAVDAIGVLPMFISLTEGISDSLRRRRIVVQSVLTAAIVAVLFLMLGAALLRVLGITVEDFMIAGGLLLFVISLRDLITAEKVRPQIDPETVGYVPIGVPLITGPAVLTTLLLLQDQFGMAVVLPAVVLNILIAGAVFWFADPITRTLGSAGTKAVSKIASLLLASIGVMMVRKGIVATILQFYK